MHICGDDGKDKGLLMVDGKGQVVMVGDDFATFVERKERQEKKGGRGGV